jgi:hypothetical protein
MTEIPGRVMFSELQIIKVLILQVIIKTCVKYKDNI